MIFFKRGQRNEQGRFQWTSREQMEADYKEWYETWTGFVLTWLFSLMFIVPAFWFVKFIIALFCI